MKNYQTNKLVDGLGKQLCLLTLLLALSFVSCRKEIPATTENDELATDNEESLASARGIAHALVHNGGSIQAAVDAANPGTLIFIEPGIYKESITVNKPGIQLVGLQTFKKKVIIDNPGEEEYGIQVTDEGDGFVLKNVTVQNFEEYGVFLVKVDNFLLDHVKSINNSEYGLFPVLCSHGAIKFCSATGSSDTGIYVGQSTDVTIQYSVAFANVSGFEIENCTNVSASWNEAYDNAAGLSVFLLPGLTIKTSSDILVENNKIYNNNHINFAPSDGGLEVFIPSGTGILLVGADNVTIRRNIIQKNNFVGLATVSTLVLGALSGAPPEAFADIEPNPDGTRIVQNVVQQNGTAAPQGLPLPAADLLWDGSGNNNCWKNNFFSISFPSALPACN